MESTNLNRIAAEGTKFLHRTRVPTGVRLGQTSFVYFVSRVIASALGFLATIYFARLLGADVLGQYYLALAVISWLKIVGVMGISGALNKRLSEGEEREAYLSAGALVILSLFLIIAGLMLLASSYVDRYVGAPITELLIVLLFAALFFGFVTSVLNGHHMVHVTGLLNPVKIASQSLLQIGAVALLSLGLTGLLGGYAVGWLAVGCLGLLIVSPSLRRPARRHFRKLFDFAKFSWLGSLQRRSFTWLDILVLGVFVPPGLVGIYSICWNIVSVLTIFGSSLSSTLFPEISKLSSDDATEEVGSLVSDSLAFAGLLVTPGLIGGGLLAERILVIYSEEFVQGTEVLWILIAGALFYGYQQQMTTALNGLDRPDVTFRINFMFIFLIAASNVAFVWVFGWIGAAVATALSSAVGALVSYLALRRLLDFETPLDEIIRQWLAAGVMGLVVYGGLWVEDTHRLLQHNVATVAILVTVGAGVYFGVLFGISPKFRVIVSNNLPFDLPVSAG